MGQATAKAAAPPWIETDIHGLRRTLERKGKAWMVFELVQNAWDTNATRADVTLSKPKNGKSILTCKDNAPDGYRDLTEAHTLFSSSGKKTDPTLRGRFNAGEKFVVIMSEQAKVTSTTGQVQFLPGNKRKFNSDITTKSGTEFWGVFEMTDEEYTEISRQVQLLFPPIKTTFNGAPVTMRRPTHTFTETLMTEVANDRGVLTPRKRKTEVRLYQPAAHETPTLYECGIPVVEIENKYHVSVEQKIPLNTERDNVTPGYLRTIHTVVAGQVFAELTPEEAAKPWVVAGIESGKLKPEAVAALVKTRFGEDAVLHDSTDIGSNKEATSQGATVIPRGTFTRETRAIIAKAGIKKAGEIDKFKTNKNIAEAEPIPAKDYDDNQKRFSKLIEVVSPLLIQHTATVTIIDDEDIKIEGCSRWREGTYNFEINLAYHDCDDWHANYELLIHEMAHYKVQSNDHLCKEFYNAVTLVGARLAKLALEQPDLFPEAIGVASQKKHKAA